MKKGGEGEKEGRRKGRREGGKNGEEEHNSGYPREHTAGFAVVGVLTILFACRKACTSFTVAMVIFPTSSKMSRISDSVSTL